MQGTDIFLK